MREELTSDDTGKPDWGYGRGFAVLGKDSVSSLRSNVMPFKGVN